MKRTALSSRLDTIKFFGKGPLTPSLRVVAWLMRLMLGATFIFSGITKAVDPYGTYYKINDYVSAIGWQLPDGILLAAAFMLFSIEFVIGIMLLCGCFRRTSSLCALLVMLFMLPLSLWLAVANPVSDCGCFGDAVPVSNWATFWKNVGLTAAAIWLLFFNRRLHWIITPALQWIALTLSIAYVVYIGFVGYIVQPPIDFRPYKVGEALVSESTESDSDVKLIYSDDKGKEHVFSLTDELPDTDNGWKFIRQESAANGEADASLSDFRIWDEEAEEDMTEAALLSDTAQLILFMPSLSSVSVSETWPINSLYRYCGEHGIDMFAVVAATPDDIDSWKDISLSEYPIYTTEDTYIKEIVRGNPALVMLRDGKIEWKQTLESIDIDELSDESGNVELADLVICTHLMFEHASWVFVALLAILALFSFIPPVFRLAKLIRRRNKIHKSSPGR